MSIIHIDGGRINFVVFGMRPNELNVHRLEFVGNAGNEAEPPPSNVESNSVIAP
jgi:hypothetical protein